MKLRDAEFTNIWWAGSALLSAMLWLAFVLVMYWALLGAIEIGTLVESLLK